MLPQRARALPPGISEANAHHESPRSPPDGATELGNHSGLPIPGKARLTNYNFITLGGWRDKIRNTIMHHFSACHTHAIHHIPYLLRLFTFYSSSSPSSTLNDQPLNYRNITIPFMLLPLRSLPQTGAEFENKIGPNRFFATETENPSWPSRKTFFIKCEL